MMPYLGEIPQSAVVGGKARGLDRLVRHNFNVPKGFVIEAAALRGTAWTSALKARLIEFEAPLYAVRSSGEGEDGETCSLAGEYRTHTRVPKADVAAAVRAVVAHAHAVAPQRPFAVVVQEWIEGDCSGVAFSRHPTRMLGEVTVIDAIRGSAEALVSGEATASRCLVWEDVTLMPPDYPCERRFIHELERLVRSVEERFGGAVDVEWTLHDKTIYLLQARRMTVEPSPTVEAEDEGRFLRLHAEDEKLRIDRSPMAESLPLPSRASLDLVRQLFRAGGPFARAAGELGLQINPRGAGDYFVTVMGRLYVDERAAPFLSPRGLFKPFSTALKTSKAVRVFPFDFYRTPWKSPRDARDMAEVLEMLDGVAGQNYARATLLARAAHLRGSIDLERLWRLRTKWLRERPAKVSAQDFELSVKGDVQPRATWTKPRNLVEAYAILKEDAKDEIRPLLAQIQTLTANPDAPLDKVNLTPADAEMAARARELRLSGRNVRLPRIITRHDLLDLRAAYRKEAGRGELAGEGVSSGVGEGATLVGHEPSAIPTGAILVVDSLTPDWFPYLTNDVRGVVAETGSGLSHGAIQCRERGIPAIFGVAGATLTFKSGMRLRVDGETGEITLGGLKV